MSLIVVGTNYKYSPVWFRERIYFSKKASRDGLRGATILSTCNRVEIYASAPDAEKGIEEIKNFISRIHEIDINKFSPYLYIYKDMDAVRHLFSVACGLDSLILGEAQILEQVKESLIESEKAGFIDSSLKGVFDAAISFADAIHKNNKIFSGDISIGSIVISFLKQRFGSIEGRNILIIGTGKVIELIVKHLDKKMPNVIFIANRTYEKAKGLANQIKARAVRFNELKSFLTKADIIITATRSPYFIIKKEMLKDVITNKILILDFAFPRDVDPKVRDIENVELLYLEDLRRIIEKDVSGKARHIKALKEMIDIEAEKLCRGYIESEPEPALLP